MAEPTASCGAPKPVVESGGGDPPPSQSSPRQQSEPRAENSPSPLRLHPPPSSPGTINTETPATASGAVTSAETLAAPPNSCSTATAEGGGGEVSGGGGGPCSFSQLLAGAMGSAAAAGGSRAVPILAVQVDAARLPVVAVPCFIAPASLLDSPGFTSQFTMTHQAVLATVTAQAQLQLQLQATTHPSSSSDSLTNSSSQPLVSAITPVPVQQRPPPLPEENVGTPEAEQLTSPHQKTPSARLVLQTNSSDGYNWRKYGQKQVKSSESSRSYYRCANSDCFVKKKVQHFQDGRVIEIVYKGCHNHDPPQKTRFSKERKSVSTGSLVEGEDIEVPSGEINESDPITPKKERDCGNISPKQQLHCSSDCEEDAGIKTEDLGDEPEPKRRLGESTTLTSAPQFKTVREPKIVVQSAGDVGLVSDGYRWRKYGQKFVKGNPNPRSYYRCTQCGCPVRKHVQRASDGEKAFVITYEGKHNHDQPFPRTVSNPSLTTAPATPGAVTDGRHMQTSEHSLDKKSAAEQAHNADREMNNDKGLGSEKALESAQTLIGIGESSRNNSESIQRPLFKENHAAVPVQSS